MNRKAEGANDMKKKYTGGFEAYEEKLSRVMGRFGVDDYTYDWNRTGCFVQMQFHGQVWRFENTLAKSQECGRNLKCVSDLFAEVVLTLEDLARATEKGLVSLDMLLQGIPSLPAGQVMEDCFKALGFGQRPESAEEVREQYLRMAKIIHPDVGGDASAFQVLKENYEQCLEVLS